MNTNIVVAMAAFSKRDIENLIEEQVNWLHNTRPDYLGDLPETGPVTVEYALGFLDREKMNDEVHDLVQSFLYDAILQAQNTASLLVRDGYDTTAALGVDTPAEV